jgi:predicted NUDIX family NTP pyrophosphohydrolase
VPRRSAGLLLHRPAAVPGGREVLLVHPGGPFWARRDDGAWSIPKGEPEPGEDPWSTALREFGEELGVAPPAGPAVPLGEVRQPGGKLVTAWAVEGDLDVSAVVSTTFDLEWPRGSGRVRTYPEVDRAGWFDLGQARVKLLAGQLPLLDSLTTALATALGAALPPSTDPAGRPRP